MVPRLIVALALALAGTAQAQPLAEEKVAILVGVNKYHAPGLARPPLNFAEADVRDLGTELSTHGYKVTTLLGDDATKAGIDAAIAKALARPNHRRTTLVGLAGHGFQDRALDEEGRVRKDFDGQALQDIYYCPVDGVESEFRTMVSFEGLMESLKGRSGTNLVLIDACRNEAPNPFRGTRAINGGAFIGRLPENMAICFACSGGQRAFETTKAGGGHGVFFWQVLEGLRGKAADPETGDVYWDSLVTYVNRRVNLRAREWFPDHARAADRDALGRLQNPQEIHGLGDVALIARVKPPPVVVANDSKKAMPPKAEFVPLRRPVGMVGTRAGDVRDDNLLAMPMVWCPPGTFTMGSPEGEKDRSDDEKQVRVTLDRGFWIGKYEFRQSDYKALMGAEPFQSKGDLGRPVESMSWNDAQKVGQTLTQRERAAGRLSVGWEYRLPTEAEWEYACRAGEKGAFSFGNDETRLSEFAWFGEELFSGSSHPVGTKKGNAWGIHDMHGNVAEWCMDGYSEALPGGLNPWGPDGTASRVGRGGDWINSAGHCRSAGRGWIGLADSLRSHGLRLVAVRSPG